MPPLRCPQRGPRDDAESTWLTHTTPNEGNPIDTQSEDDDFLVPRMATWVVWLAFLLPLTVSGAGFILARSYDWTFGWLYLGILGANLAIQTVMVLIWNPVLISRRSTFGGNTKRWDIVILILLTLCILGIFLTLRMDQQALGPAYQPGWAWLLASVVFALGMGMMTWSSVINPFLEKTVRIQDDHQHQVIDTGPYALVRHPFYVGCIALLLATPVMLASVTSWIPALGCVLVLVVRTALEDRTLQAELAGYQDYATRVRARLLPGVY